MNVSDFCPPSTWLLNWQPIDAGKPKFCSDCGGPLGHPQHRAPQMIEGELCAYFCAKCFDSWFGPFDLAGREEF